MAPPKVICSVYADGLTMYAKMLEVIATIRETVAKIVATKNKIKYGLIPLSALASAAAGAVAGAAATVAGAIASQLLAAASSLVAAAIEAVLAPLLAILMSGPEAIYSLVNLPLVEATKACDKERLYLSRAKANLDLVVALFSKWVYEFGGGKYADKMQKALPFIIEAIDKCESMISMLDVSEDAGVTARFDTSRYNSMRSDILNALEITESESMLINAKQLENNIERKANIEIERKTAENKEWYKTEKDKITKKYVESKHSIIDTSTYNLTLTKLNSEKKVRLEEIKLRAKKRAVLDDSTYAGIINNPADRFINDMQLIGDALEDFATNISTAFVAYKISRAMTHSVYSIERLINFLISKMIELIGRMGDGAGKALTMPLRLSKNVLIKVKEMYEESLDRYYSPDGSISTVGLSVKLAAGNISLIGVDSVLSASVTKSLIEAVNADEAMAAEHQKLMVLFKKIEEIPDWDGTPNKWGTDPMNSVTSPYRKLLLLTAGMLGSLLTGFKGGRGRLVDMNKKFDDVVRHNSIVSSALRSYTPPVNNDVEALRKSMSPLILIAFLSGKAAFDITVALGSIIGDARSGDTDRLLDIPTLDNCQAFYPKLFGIELTAAQVATDTMQTPPTFSDQAAADMEESDMDRVSAMSEIRNLDPEIDDSDMVGVE